MMFKCFTIIDLGIFRVEANNTGNYSHIYSSHPIIVTFLLFMSGFGNSEGSLYC